MIADMRISANGIELIKRFEGLELESYQDIAGIWTIGYGHTETAGPNQKITEREAEQLLMQDLRPRERAVDSLANVPLNQNEFDALVSFVYNVGENAFRGSTARRRLNQNNRLGAADALTWWNKATVGGVLVEVTGLTRRRAAERALFLTPAAPVANNNLESISENTRTTPVEDPPRRGNLGESRTIQGATVAGGAGAAASTMGRDSAEELDDLETNIENGSGLTAEDQSGASQSNNGATGDADAGPDDVPSDDIATNDQGTSDAGSDDVGSDDATTSSDETEIVDGTSDEAVSDDATPGDASSTTGSSGGVTETIGMEDLPPSKHEKHAVDSQVQFALLILILLSVLYIIYARIEDWFTYRR